MATPSVQFQINPSSGVPIYRQIVDQMRTRIVGGQFGPGHMLPSVRELAASLQINVMTVSKAYTRLESIGLIERVRGLGMRVCQRDAKDESSDRNSALLTQSTALVREAIQLGFTDNEILAGIRAALREARS